MSKKPNQKLKLLYLAKIFFEKTDENHHITMSEIISELEKYDIQAERKSLYDDFEQLNIFGMDICKTRGKIPGYFNASSEFELAELKLLTDAVESAKFISQKKSIELISKIEKLTSIHNAKKLQRQVYVANRVKTLNEHIYYNVDKIHDAITENKKIAFKYFDYTIEKEKKYRKNGELYVESPISLMWDDENYYLVAYNSKHNAFIHYRVDRMEKISMCDEERMGTEKDFDPASYARKTFSMFSGEEKLVKMRFDNSLINVVFDRFGMDITPFRDGDSNFIITANVSVSHQFFGWIASLGGRAEIISPEDVKNEFIKMLDNVIKSYI